MTAEIFQYKNSPLREVVFEALIDDSRLLTMEEIEKFLEDKGYNSRFPDKQKRFKFEGEIDFNNSIPTSDTKNYDDGFSCLDEDKSQVLIIRPNGFGFVFLKPYLGWESSSETFFNYIHDISNFFEIKTFSRFAVRSINQINFNGDLKAEYFNLQLDHHIEKLDACVKSIVSQKSLNIANHIPNLKVNIIEAFNFEGFNSTLSYFMLDIDVFSENTYNLEKQDLHDIFKEIRITKNRVFESYLNVKSREYFNK